MSYSNVPADDAVSGGPGWMVALVPASTQTIAAAGPADPSGLAFTVTVAEVISARLLMATITIRAGWAVSTLAYTDDE